MKKNRKTKHFSRGGSSRYGSKNYSNPFFQTKRRKRLNIDPKTSWKIKIVTTIIFVLAVALIYLFIYSQYFTIQNINATGEGNNLGSDKIREIAESQINNNMFILWPQRNIFLFNEATLKENLENKYSFDQLEISKKLPNELTIKFVEKKHSVIWQEGEKYFYADKTGIITTETNPIEIQQKDYPLINNLSNKKIENNTIKIEEKYLQYSIDLFEELKKHDGELTIDRFIIDDDLNTVKVALLEGPQVYFNIEEPVGKQLNKLIVIKNEKIKENFSSKSYIDVRIGDSVYYR